MTRAVKQSAEEEESRRRVKEWIQSDRGVLSRVAVICRCSPQFVQQVAYGKSTTAVAHKPIEVALRALGWPGIIRKGRVRINR